MKTTSVFDRSIKAYNEGYGLIINRGGTRSGKTFAVLQLLFLIAIYSKTRLVITVVSHSFPHLEMGAVRDMNNILLEEGINPEDVSTKRPYIYKIGKCVIEFISVDNIGKSLGAARDILFVNEANKIPHNIYHQLMIRTTVCTFLDFNPSEKFWLSENNYDTDVDSIEIISTYLDNIQNLTLKQVEELQKARERADKEQAQGKFGYWSFWWRVYGEGEYGRLIDRLVFPGYNVIDEVPKGVKLKGYGLDFGYSVDPTAVEEIYVSGKDVYINQLVYETGLINVKNPGLPNRSIEEKIKKLINNELFIIADSAEPKSIAELRLAGFNMYAVKKPKIKDSLRQMLQYNIYITDNSKKIIHEFDNYLYPIDKNDNIIDGEPVGPDHAIDGIRYFLSMKDRVWT